MVEHGSHSPEQLNKAKRLRIDHDPEGKELSRIKLQRTHKVQNQREARNLQHDDGNVRDGVGDAESRGSVEAEPLVPHQDWPSHEGGCCLGHGLEEEVENGEEEDAGAEEDGFAG